jgi:hypothetical protein
MNVGELRTAAICYNDSAFAIAVSPSVVIATPTVLFSEILWLPFWVSRVKVRCVVCVDKFHCIEQTD